MSTARQMPEKLRQFFEGDESLVFPMTLLSGYQSGTIAPLVVLEHNDDPNGVNFFVAGQRRSFPSYMDAAVRANILAPKCRVILTTRTAVPCADAIRGFSDTRNILDLTYGYIYPDF